MAAAAGDDNPDGEAPVTIFVLDLLNSPFENLALSVIRRGSIWKAQPPQLSSPAEIMVIGNDSLEVVQGFTRNKEDLLFALNHIPAVLPYKIMNGAFFWERFFQSDRRPAADRPPKPGRTGKKECCMGRTWRSELEHNSPG